MTKAAKYLLFFLGLCLTLAVMTWYDLQPKRTEQLEIVAESYLATPTTTLQDIPDDNVGLIFVQGVMSVDGILSEPAAIAPKIFPQREVALYFILPELPDSFAAVTAGIQKSLKDWEHEGNEISAIYIEYSPEEYEWEKLAGFLKGLKTALSTYRIGFAGNAGAIGNDEETRNAFANLMTDVGTYAFYSQSSDDNISVLDALGIPYRLIVSPSADLQLFFAPPRAMPKNFKAFIQTL